MVLRQQYKRLRGIDPYWEVDEAVLRHCLGSKGASLIKQRWSDRCLPEHSRSVEASVEASHSLVNSQAYKWSSAPVRGELDSVHTMLVRIKQGEAMLASTSLASWCGKVAVELQAFIQVDPDLMAAVKEKGAKKKYEDPEALRGQEALVAMWEALKKQNGPKTLKQLATFSVWRHLLTEDDRKMLVQWRDSLVKSASSGTKPVVASRQVKPAKKQQKKGALTDAVVDDAARALFKMR